MTPEAIQCQIRAIADHLVDADYPVRDLRCIAAEMADTRTIVELVIWRRNERSASSNSVLAQLMGGPEGGAA